MAGKRFAISLFVSACTTASPGASVAANYSGFVQKGEKMSFAKFRLTLVK